MGIMSNTVSICHFRVQGELIQHDDRAFWDFAHELLARHGFTPIDESLEELSIGWVHLDDSKQSHFTSVSDCWRDRYLVFSLRRDQRKVPAALLQERLEKACSEFLDENGLSRVPKQKKAELKELVREQLLAKALPDPKVYDFVWDTQQNVATFSTLSAKTTEILEDLFKKTFEGLRLGHFIPYERAMGVIPTHHQPLLRQANRAGSENYLDLLQSNQWLGTDFLGWLLYQTLNGSSEYQVNQPGPEMAGTQFVGYIDDKVVLIGEGDSGTQVTTVNGPQDRFAEVKSALQGRKLITEATIHMEADDSKWCLTLKGGVFHFASFSSPAVRIEKDNTVDEQMEREAVFFERMLLLEKGLQLFDSLFATFLASRLSGNWSSVEAGIIEWVSEP